MALDIQPPMPPIFDTPGELIEVVRDATWWALGKPIVQRIYVTTQGDFWDMIAIRVYGKQRGNEHLMFRLIEENYALRDVVCFPAGIPVNVPEVDVQTEILLVPWKKATVTPNT